MVLLPDNDITLRVMYYAAQVYKICRNRVRNATRTETTTFRDNDKQLGQEAASIMQRTNLIKGKPGNIFELKGKRQEQK